MSQNAIFGLVCLIVVLAVVAFFFMHGRDKPDDTDDEGMGDSPAVPPNVPYNPNAKPPGAPNKLVP